MMFRGRRRGRSRRMEAMMVNKRMRWKNKEVYGWQEEEDEEKKE